MLSHWLLSLALSLASREILLRETFGPETAEIENIVWQTINGVFEEVLNPEYFKRTVEKNPWTWTLRQVFNSSFHLIGRKTGFSLVEI